MENETEKYSDFVVTARKYQTLLTKKFQNRKVWTEPNPFLIQSFIPGTIIEIFAKEGDFLEEGESLLILEAMKMRNRIEMPFAARIKSIKVNVGDKIPKDITMVELELVETDIE